jgi:DNA-binding NtrC family response regulator
VPSVAALQERVRGWFRREPKVAAPRELLIAEADDKERRALVRMVQRMGYSPLEASGAVDAVKLLEEHFPECVLLAFDVDDGNGLEALSQVRGTAPEVPVIMVARDYHDGRTVEALRRGAVAYLARPFGPDDLREVLGRPSGR